MLSAEQLIIVAYAHDGILCRECGEGNPETKMGEALSAYEAGEYAGADGLTCEECGKEIIEPYTWTCPTCDTEYTGDEADTAESEYGWCNPSYFREQHFAVPGFVGCLVRSV